ncbi:Na(+)-translocating NADH-quinone reductase subunit A [Gynuella sp.]|uniref:Na(+)-translocating NADH-quinone reductase subunit A n=1 Tax=Gynuella sp. TaxID=2969146 RepID=UPI003D122AC4
MIEIKKGLDLPITGKPKQSIRDGKSVSSVAVVGFDYHGLKPTMKVKEGDKVKLGQILFSDKKNDGVVYTAPGAGVVKQINRGARRVFQSLVIDLEGDESESFESYESSQLAALSRDKVVSNLVNSGLWTALRTRPFSKVPKIDSAPNSIFVTAIDTNPLAADPAVIIAEQKDAFVDGLAVLARLTEGKVFLCKAPGADIPSGSAQVQEFGGKHPAGNVGTHIHFVDPVSRHKTVWTIGYQDVIAIGKLFTTGQLYVERVVAIAGPQASDPGLVRTRVGASLQQLTADEAKPGENRLISGSVFGGRNATADAFAYLGRYHSQVSILKEGRDRDMLHYVRPGFNYFSVLNTFISSLSPSKKFDFDTSANGSERCFLPLGNFEKVMPLDILPAQLLRSLIVGDIDTAEKLGALELDEEDLSLCTFVCTGKYEYGAILRSSLTRIELEG